MRPYRQVKQDPELKKDIFTTLAISALLNGTNDSVRHTAAKLAENATRSFKKTTLLPLADSAEAYDIIMETVVVPLEEAIFGTARYNGFEYELILRWTDASVYEHDVVMSLITSEFIKRGCVTGRLYIDVAHPYLKTNYKTSFDLNELSSYSATYDAA